MSMCGEMENLEWQIKKEEETLNLLKDRLEILKKETERKKDTNVYY